MRATGNNGVARNGMSIQLSLNGLSFYSGGGVRTVDFPAGQGSEDAWWEEAWRLLERENAGLGGSLFIQYATSEAVLCPAPLFRGEDLALVLRAKGLIWDEAVRRPAALFYGDYALPVLLPSGLVDRLEVSGRTFVLSHPLLACLKEAERYTAACGGGEATVANCADGMLFVVALRGGRLAVAAVWRVDNEADVLFYVRALMRDYPTAGDPVVCQGIYAPWLARLLEPHYSVAEAPLELYFGY